jgi:hypothetical protein
MDNKDNEPNINISARLQLVLDQLESFSIFDKNIGDYPAKDNAKDSTCS